MPEFCRTAVFGASLCALRKPDGGIRPIAVGSLYRRLAAKIAAKYAANKLKAELSPIQLGIGISGGCESAVHAARQYICLTNSNSDDVILKVDVKNAYNSIHRCVVLKEIKERCPEIYPLAYQSYSESTPLYIGETMIVTNRSTAGRPLGPIGICFGYRPHH